MEELKVMTMEDLPEILNWEMSQLQGDGLEKEMQSWHAPWRREALEHYIPLGWSFLKRNQGQVVAYVLTQPFLFFQGWTQTLWVEHVSAVEAKDRLEMLEVAYRWARDKHLQKIFFKKNWDFVEDISFGKTYSEGEYLSMNTTKM